MLSVIRRPNTEEEPWVPVIEEQGRNIYVIGTYTIYTLKEHIRDRNTYTLKEHIRHRNTYTIKEHIRHGNT